MRDLPGSPPTTQRMRGPRGSPPKCGGSSPDASRSQLQTDQAASSLSALVHNRLLVRPHPSTVRPHDKPPSERRVPRPAPGRGDLARAARAVGLADLCAALTTTSCPTETRVRSDELWRPRQRSDRGEARTKLATARSSGRTLTSTASGLSFAAPRLARPNHEERREREVAQHDHRGQPGAAAQP